MKWWVVLATDAVVTCLTIVNQNACFPPRSPERLIQFFVKANI